MAVTNWTDAQVIAQLDSGFQWTALTITYAFPTSRRGMYGVDGERPGFEAVDSVQQDFFRLAMKNWGDLIAPSLLETASTNSDIEFGYSSSMSGYAQAYYPDVGSAWFSTTVGQDANNSTTAPTVGLYGFETIMHEIGHALGLNHMGSYNGAGAWQPSSYQDSTVLSIMSYFGPGGSLQSPDVAQADWTAASGIHYSPQTPMLNDVMAIQSIYGASTQTRIDDTVYGFSCNIAGISSSIFDFSLNLNPILTIFDSAGSDTLNVSGWSTPSVIYLESGVYSSCNDMTNNIVIAYNCVVENAIGGGGDDVLGGNSSDNKLDGGAGADWLYGGLGNDTYHVDTQGDLVFENPGEGDDTAITSTSFYLYEHIENLTLATGAGNLFGSANALDNTITGNEGNNLLLGWDGNDTLMGNAGADILYGVEGNDSLLGGSGIDVLVAGNGDDSLDGGTEADELYGEAGNDTLYGGAGFVTDILTGGEGNDTLDGSASQASGESRNEGDYDLMDGGAGDDTYWVDTPADLTFEAAAGGTDTVIADINGAGYYLYAWVEHLILIGNTPFGVGNELDNRLTGSEQANWLLGGAGADTLNGQGGNDVLFGESGADTFVFETGTGGDVIGDYQAGVDRIDLQAIGYSSYAQVQANMHQYGADTAIDLGNADLVVLVGVAMASLSAGDFVLG